MNDKLSHSNLPNLILWAFIVVTLILIPFRILSHGYIPTDDAMRHSAKVVSEKPWEEILVRRDSVTIDHNRGWHSILASVRYISHWGTDGLVTFSVAFLCGLVLLSGVPWVKHPESWICGFLLINIASIKTLGYRLAMGRPYLLSIAVYITILFAWKEKDRIIDGWKLILSTALLIAIASWAHGCWYLFAIPVLGFILTARWKDAFQIGISFITGIILAALMTGHPVEFLFRQIQLGLETFADKVPTILLVPEFRPSDGAWPVVILLMLFAIRRGRKDQSMKTLLKNPAFVLIWVCWILGFKIQRFWLDWGMPSAFVWLSLEIDQTLQTRISKNSLSRYLSAAFVTILLFYTLTADFGSRWSYFLSIEYLDKTNSTHAPLLPGDGGIIYSNTMETYFLTFFKNPHGNWRYMVGHEPTQMPKDDLRTFRAISLFPLDPESFTPWISKMRSEDRIILKDIPRPDIPELEWVAFNKDTWIGRLSRQP